MINFIEFDEKTKVLKSINLDEFSIEDLEEYIVNLTNEIRRSENEIIKRKTTKEAAQKFFK